jgi:hypothetical protein
MEKAKYIKIQGQLFFAHQMTKKNTAFSDDGKYELQLGNLDEATVQRLESELNVTPKEKDDDQYNRGKFIVCKSMYPFRASDMDGNEIDPATIGNGSVAVIKALSSREWEVKKRSGVSPTAHAKPNDFHVVVKQLIEYVPEQQEEEEML